MTEKKKIRDLIIQDKKKAFKLTESVLSNLVFSLMVG